MNKIVYVVLFASLASGSAMAHCYKEKKANAHHHGYYLVGNCYEHKSECEQVGGGGGLGSCELIQDCVRSKGCWGVFPFMPNGEYPLLPPES